MRLRDAGPRRGLPVAGLLVAAIGFFVTRFTVTLAADDTRLQFLLGGVVPLVLGLLLAVVGVVLAVGSFDRAFVRTVARWCVAGTLAMAALVGLTLASAIVGGPGAGGPVRTDLLLSNFLIGGALLGTVTGVYAGLNRRNRESIRHQANRLVTINRILRHEVLNAVTVIRGRAETLGEPVSAGHAPDGGYGESIAQILVRSDQIVGSVQDVTHLTRAARSGAAALVPIDLGEAVERAVETARDRNPDVSFAFEGDAAAPVEVWADGHLASALLPLLENAARYGDPDAPEVDVEVAVGRSVACVRISDTGPGLPAQQRATLERGVISDFDDPSSGFGVNVVRMYVEGYGGSIRTDVTDDGTTVEVALSLASRARPSRTEPSALRRVGVARSDLVVATLASLVAGGAMGLYIQQVAGVIPVIGALYGVADPLVGWLTHEFHSVVFGLTFAGVLALLPPAYAERPSVELGVGVSWALLLWLVAAGVIMPLWLTLVGVPASLPSLSTPALVGHLIWGVTLVACYHVGTTLFAARAGE